MKNLSIPISIVIAGIIIAGAVVLVGDDRESSPSIAREISENSRSAQPTPGGGAPDVTLAAVTEDDHIRGSVSSPIKIVEFSDIECPFCQRFHPTMQQIVDEYNGQVAWVYRHFPLTNIHPGAQRKAEATECVAELAGNEKFWEYIDILFTEGTPTGDLSSVANRVGVDQDEFDECLSSGRHTATVQEQAQDAIASGGQGTPHSIIVTPDGDLFPISGAQPFDVIKQLVDAILEA